MSGHIPINFGYVAKGQTALLKVQKDDTELQRILRKQANQLLEIQHEQNEANAHGIMVAANAEAESDKLDAINYGVQAGTSAVQIGHTAYNQVQTSKALSDVETRQSNLEEFNTTFQKTPEGGRMLSDEEIGDLSPAQQQRLRELQNGEGELKLQEGERDNELLAHIKADAQSRRALAKHINKTRESQITEQNTIVTGLQYKMQLIGLGYSIAKDSMQSATAGLKEQTARDRGYGQATSALAQNGEQNANTSLNQFLQEAETYAQLPAALNKAREALAGNGQAS